MPKNKFLTPGELVKQQAKDKREVAEFENKKSITRGITKTLASFDPRVPRVKTPRAVIVPQQYSKEQTMMQEMFDGEKTVFGGTGKDLPKINGVLISGNGLIKTGEVKRRTANMFGFGY